MGKASSSKKVARAAKAGGSSTSRQRRLGFPAAVVAIVVVGVGLVVFARVQLAAGDVSPEIGEHWHSAYGIWLCDSFAAPLSDVGQDINGIHTHDDGLIHIHPFSSNASGEQATLSVFADQVGLEVADDSFTMPDGTTYASGDDCQGEEGVVQLLRWPAGGYEDDPEVITEDLGDVRFDENGQVYVLAFMKPGDDVPLPASLEGINTPSDLAPGETVPEVEVPGGVETGELGTPTTGVPDPEGAGGTTVPASDPTATTAP